MIIFPEPTEATGLVDPTANRAEVFLRYLDYFRGRAIEKVDELADADVVRSRLPSGWSPIELVNHLLWVERRWVQWGFLGVDVDDPWGDEIDGRWGVRSDLAPDDVVDQLREQGRRTRDVVEAHDLDEVGAPGPRWRGAEPATLERVLFHLLQEWARHLGHLDVVVELAHGGVGE